MSDVLRFQEFVMKIVVSWAYSHFQQPDFRCFLLPSKTLQYNVSVLLVLPFPLLDALESLRDACYSCCVQLWRAGIEHLLQCKGCGLDEEENLLPFRRSLGTIFCLLQSIQNIILTQLATQSQSNKRQTRWGPDVFIVLYFLSKLMSCAPPLQCEQRKQMYSNIYLPSTHM